MMKKRKLNPNPDVMTNTLTNMNSRLGRIFICTFLAASALQLTAPFVMAEAATPDAAASATAPIVKHESLWDEIVKGGGVMIPIAACSIAMIWLITDCVMRTSAKRLAPEPHITGTRDLFRMGDYVGAYQFCKNNPSPFSDTVRVALSYSGDGQTATEDAVMGEISKVSSQIQTRINYLSVIGVCTPMIGLVGTVIGMIKAFKTMGNAGITDPGKLSAAIGEVLVATASGLFIAIPAFMFFYFLRNKLQGAIIGFQDVVVSLFRKMPYEHLKDCHVGEEEFFAATPNWVEGAQAPVAA